MSVSRGDLPLSYRRLSRLELGGISNLELDPDQVARFLGPVPDILDAVRRGPAHSMIGIEAAGDLVGFYVIHPDLRDRSSWWLGWFAIDRRQQGRGYGRRAVISVMRRLRQVPGCRRIKLLVAPENTHALRLYGQAGFRQVGTLGSTGELVLEMAQADDTRSGRVAPVLMAIMPASVMRRRVRSAGAPPAAKMHGAFHGPPGRAAATRYSTGR